MRVYFSSCFKRCLFKQSEVEFTSPTDVDKHSQPIIVCRFSDIPSPDKCQRNMFNQPRQALANGNRRQCTDPTKPDEKQICCAVCQHLLVQCELSQCHEESKRLFIYTSSFITFYSESSHKYLYYVFQAKGFSGLKE